MKPLITISLLIFIACDSGVTPPRIEAPEYRLITESNIDSMTITFADYNQLTLSHQLGSSLSSNNFKKVAVGVPDSTGFKELFSSGSTYDPALDLFFFDFDFTLALNISKLETPLNIRYYLRDSGFVQIDTTILNYKYPYKNAEVFLTSSIMIHPATFQDIDRIENKVYFHPGGSLGLYEHDLSTTMTRLLVDYGSGNHIAADSIYVFTDAHNIITRFNILADTVDLILNVIPANHLIRGLETYQNILYAIVQQGSPNHYLLKYTYDGALLDSTSFPGAAFHLTINNGILYTTDFNRTIRRIDLANMSIFPNLKAPLSGMEGIRIINDQLYYCDWEKRIVCQVPMADLN